MTNLTINLNHDRINSTDIPTLTCLVPSHTIAPKKESSVGLTTGFSHCGLTLIHLDAVSGTISTLRVMRF